MLGEPSLLHANQISLGQSRLEAAAVTHCRATAYPVRHRGLFAPRFTITPVHFTLTWIRNFTCSGMAQRPTEIILICVENRRIAPSKGKGKWSLGHVPEIFGAWKKG